MKKMKAEILFAAVLLGNVLFIQAMTRSTQVLRQFNRPGARFQSGFGRSQKQEQMSEIEVGEPVNPLREKRLQEERKKEQGEEPFQPVKLKTMKELDELDEEAQKEYIESLRNELEERKKSNRWQWETLPFADVPRSELMQIKYTDEKPKRQLIKSFDRIQNLKLKYNETKRQIEKEQIEKEQIEKEQEKTEEGLWKWFRSLFSSGSKE
jgi:hypothetical protein